MMPFTSVESGLLFRDSFARPDGEPGPDWEFAPWEETTWQIVNGRLRVTDTRTNGQGAGIAMCVALGDLFECTVQAHWIAPAHNASHNPLVEPWVGGRIAIVDDGRALNYAVGVQYFDGSWVEMALGVYDYFYEDLFLEYDEPQFLVDGEAYYTTFDLRLNEQRFWNAQGELSTAAEDLSPFAAGKPGLVSFIRNFGGPTPQLLEFTSFIICTSTTLTVAGVPEGYTLALGSASALSTGDDVELEIGGVRWGDTPMQVRDGSGTIVESWSDPAGVFGGNRYVYSGSPWRSCPVLPSVTWVQS